MVTFITTKIEFSINEIIITMQNHMPFITQSIIIK